MSTTPQIAPTIYRPTGTSPATDAPRQLADAPPTELALGDPDFTTPVSLPALGLPLTGAPRALGFAPFALP